MLVTIVLTTNTDPSIFILFCVSYDMKNNSKQRALSLTSSSVLKPGKHAPDFTLRTTPDQEVSLSQFRSRPTILAFYPADFSPVCGDQMTLYNEILPEFQKF